MFGGLLDRLLGLHLGLPAFVLFMRRLGGIRYFRVILDIDLVEDPFRQFLQRLGPATRQRTRIAIPHSVRRRQTLAAVRMLPHPTSDPKSMIENVRTFPTISRFASA